MENCKNIKYRRWTSFNEIFFLLKCLRKKNCKEKPFEKKKKVSAALVQQSSQKYKSSFKNTIEKIYPERLLDWMRMTEASPPVKVSNCGKKISKCANVLWYMIGNKFHSCEYFLQNVNRSSCKKNERNIFSDSSEFILQFLTRTNVHRALLSSFSIIEF